MELQNLKGVVRAVPAPSRLAVAAVAAAHRPERLVHPGVKLVGHSAAMDALRESAAGIASRRSTVLIRGETGTGKEVLAHYIHSLSDRAAMPFIPVDCSALTESLFESQLFGHCQGAFTGATRDTLGFFRAADSGTLFLDEIGELPLQHQAKLLRVLQERAVVPVGESRPRPVDVRVIAATHRDLADMVSRGTFRQDLFFRLNVIALNVPPLRERPEDVLPLASHFLAQQAGHYGDTPRGLSAEAAAALQTYSWPGNVREVSNAMEHAHALACGLIIRRGDLPRFVCETSPIPGGDLSDLHLPTVERRLIAEALRRTKYCKSAASRLLGLDRKRLDRRLAHYGIELPD